MDFQHSAIEVMSLYGRQIVSTNINVIQLFVDWQKSSQKARRHEGMNDAMAFTKWNVSHQFDAKFFIAGAGTLQHYVR